MGETLLAPLSSRRTSGFPQCWQCGTSLCLNIGTSVTRLMLRAILSHGTFQGSTRGHPARLRIYISVKLSLPVYGFVMRAGAASVPIGLPCSLDHDNHSETFGCTPEADLPAPLAAAHPAGPRPPYSSDAYRGTDGALAPRGAARKAPGPGRELRRHRRHPRFVHGRLRPRHGERVPGSFDRYARPRDHAGFRGRVHDGAARELRHP